MAQFTYKELREKYGEFQYPLSVIRVGDTDLAKVDGFKISDIRIESGVGYEAGAASFLVAGTWDPDGSYFESNKIKKYLALGSVVTIALGYSNSARSVFKGFISKLSYVNVKKRAPGVIVTCMDIKGLMMSGTSSRQFKDAKCYSDAVKEILDNYNSDILNGQPKIESTPDKSEGTENEDSPKTIEMVDESDYEFVVKAAKKFNYEFLVSAGTVVFRPARNNTDLLMELGFSNFINVSVEQNLIGQVESVEVRAFDTDTGKLIKGKSKSSGAGKKAISKLVSGTKKVYLDPSCLDQNEVDKRAEYLMQENAYKFVTLHATVVGLPELTAGRFITLEGLYQEGGKVEFYLHQVIHKLTDSGYTTEIIGRAQTMEKKQ